MEYNKLTAALIKKNRIERGYKSSYMAFKIGMSNSTYSQLENGNTEITVTKLINIAYHLNVSVISLLPPKIVGLKEEHLTIQQLKTEFKKFIDLIDELDI